MNEALSHFTIHGNPTDEDTVKPGTVEGCQQTEDKAKR